MNNENLKKAQEAGIEGILTLDPDKEMFLTYDEWTVFLLGEMVAMHKRVKKVEDRFALLLNDGVVE